MAYAASAPIRRVNTARAVPMSGIGADAAVIATTNVPGIGTYAAWALVATVVGAAFFVLGKEIYETR